MFLGHQGNRVKILHWDRGGLVLYYKRLEKGRFVRPKVSLNEAIIELDAVEMTMLLDDIQIHQVKPPVLWKPVKNCEHWRSTCTSNPSRQAEPHLPNKNQGPNKRFIGFCGLNKFDESILSDAIVMCYVCCDQLVVF